MHPCHHPPPSPTKLLLQGPHRPTHTRCQGPGQFYHAGTQGTDSTHVQSSCTPRQPRSQTYADRTGFPKAVKLATCLRTRPRIWCPHEDRMAVPRPGAGLALELSRAAGPGGSWVQLTDIRGRWLGRGSAVLKSHFAFFSQLNCQQKLRVPQNSVTKIFIPLQFDIKDQKPRPLLTFFL